MNRGLLVSASVLVASPLIAQTAPSAPGAQVREIERPSTPTSTSDSTKVTQADRGSAVDTPALRSPEPQTGAHPPVIGTGTAGKPPAHAVIRARAAVTADQCGSGSAALCERPKRP